jgi:lysine/ornithine N-monooxygenase
MSPSALPIHTKSEEEDPQVRPVSDSILPFWRTQLHELDNHRSTEELPSQCDILIIGAGFSGAALTYHLLQEYGKDKLPSTVVLEARQACSGATARNGEF